MRFTGPVVSLIGHIGAVMMTLLAWELNSSLPDNIVTVVPIEIVDVGLEPNVRALAEDVPDEEVSATPEIVPEQAQPEPAPTPRPTPRQTQRDRDVQAFNDLVNSGLEDRSRDPGRRREEGQRADRTQRGVGLGTAERTTLQARANSIAYQEVKRCWRSVIDMPDPERLVVVVTFRLNRDGSLSGQPDVTSPGNYTFDPQMAEAVRRAVSAIRICDSRESFARLANDPFVGEHYELWRDNEVTFSLRTMQ